MNCQRKRISQFWLVALLFLSAGCASPKFAPVNFQEPGWQVTQTQAVWKPRKDAPEIAGDLIVATNQTGSAFISFSKTLPLITAQSEPQGWRIEAPENRKYSAPGKPPKRIVWFQIAPAMIGGGISKPWTLEKNAAGNILLGNKSSGEWLEITK